MSPKQSRHKQKNKFGGLQPKKFDAFVEIDIVYDSWQKKWGQRDCIQFQKIQLFFSYDEIALSTSVIIGLFSNADVKHFTQFLDNAILDIFIQ